ncbi:MAG TPA: hypothetical protein VFE33_16535 [Thermoanaerobaculia bacterium]|nr:hypothetical protein [Thermoanaerobaculia bacterium]
METFETFERTLPQEKAPTPPARLFRFRSSPRAAKDLPPWSPGKRLLFRFTFSYLALYILPFPLIYIPYVAVAAGWYQKLWRLLVPWVGKQVFHVDITVFPNGSGDTTFNYVQLVCHLAIATAATLLWTLLDRRRTQYIRLFAWLRTFVRFSLASAMIGYGAAKVIQSQFPAPTLSRLLQPFGDASPMGLLWTFMGASRSYNFFGGAAEMLGGLLLTLRRTTLLGALVTIAVMANVVMLNFSYDVPVKLYSLHLLAMAAFLVVPDLRRLAGMFLFNREVAPAVDRPLFTGRWLHHGTRALRTLLVLAFVWLSIQETYEGLKLYGELAPKPPLYGIWNVDEITVAGTARPPLVTDLDRWRRVAFDYPGMASIQLMNDSRRRYTVAIDTKKRTLQLAKRDDPKTKYPFSYQQTGPETLLLQGTFEGQPVVARLHRMKESSYPLLNRGFHWINEYPFNR